MTVMPKNKFTNELLQPHYGKIYVKWVVLWSIFVFDEERKQCTINDEKKVENV